MPTTNSRRIATSLFKALDLLSLLSSSKRGLGIYDIVQAMSLPRSSLLRLLDSLMSYGFVGRDPEKRYFTTSKFREWRTADARERIVARFEPMMEEIAAKVGEMALLGRLEGRRIRYLHVEEPNCRVRVSPPMEKQYPLERMAMGKLAMSCRPDLVPEPCSPKLLGEIDQARQDNYAWNWGESETGIVTWATWLGEPSGLTPLLVVAWPDFRFSESSVEKVQSILRGYSEELGPFAMFDERS